MRFAICAGLSTRRASPPTSPAPPSISPSRNCSPKRRHRRETRMTVKTRKKLIEVALPLDAINAASAREKSIRHGHPSTLHLWWARRPLAAARAVIFAQMVDDPCEYVPELLGDPKLKRKAEAELKVRRVRWLEARAAYDKAVGEGVQAPEPGREPTL